MQAVYPALTALDELCSKAAIRFPIDHIMTGKTELCKEALTYAYGPDFVAKHAYQRSNFVQTLGQDSLVVGRRLNFSWNGEEFVDDDNVCLVSESGSRVGVGAGVGLGHAGEYEKKQSDRGSRDTIPDKVSIQGSDNHNTPTALPLLTGVQRDDQVLALLQQHIQELTDCAAESEATYSQTIRELTAAKDLAEQRAREMEERVKSTSQQHGPGQGQGPAFLRAEIERLKSTNMELETRTRSLNKELLELSSKQNDSLHHQSPTAIAETNVLANGQKVNELEKKVERSQARIDELLNQSMASHREIVMLEQANSMLKEALLSSQSSSLPIATAVTISQPSSSSSSSPQQVPPPPPVMSPPPLIAVAAREVSRLTLPSYSELSLAAPMSHSLTAATGTKTPTIGYNTIVSISPRSLLRLLHSPSLHYDLMNHLHLV